MSMRSAIFYNNNKFNEFTYLKEDDLEASIVKNSKLLFGNSIIYIDAKKKIDSKSLGGAIPDGFLFDLSDVDNPEFYLVEVELATHDFYKHIFPQVTKFFAFFKNPKSQNELIEKIFSVINNNDNIKKEFKRYLGEKELYKFIKDTIENSSNILLILDDNKPELPEIIETYTDTWDKMVRIFILKEYRCGKEVVLHLSPDFESVKFGAEFIDISEEESPEKEKYTEEYHLEGVSVSVKDIYQTVKTKMLEVKPTLIFNPQKYYISIADKKNFAYIRLRKKKLRIVVTIKEDFARTIVKHYQVKTLSEGVQNFYGRECCDVIIDNDSNIGEIIGLLQTAIERTP